MCMPARIRLLVLVRLLAGWSRSALKFSATFPSFPPRLTADRARSLLVEARCMRLHVMGGQASREEPCLHRRQKEDCELGHTTDGLDSPILDQDRYQRGREHCRRQQVGVEELNMGGESWGASKWSRHVHLPDKGTHILILMFRLDIRKILLSTSTSSSALIISTHLIKQFTPGSFVFPYFNLVP